MKKKVVKKLKKVTLDDLAIMVAKGFAEQDHNLKSEIGGVKSEIDGVKSEIEEFKSETKKAFFEVQSDMHTVKERLTSIEKTLGPLLHVVDSLKFNSRDFETRLTRLEKKTGIIK